MLIVHTIYVFCKNWKKKYEKVYPKKQEEHKRMLIWNKNREKVEKQNEAYKKVFNIFYLRLLKIFISASCI